LHEGGALAPDVPQDLAIIAGIKWGATQKRELFPGKTIDEPLTIYLLGEITYTMFSQELPGTRRSFA
jgi:hypothetical protein